ncbi:uncharacterized protein AMSG_12353 [Thecamonas trahens ATCC 50062]|uniref:dolichyl-phosphate-mannose--protein mannosyltransferase n=1 Tax=Thecamonas trahens ATCC 50062 TaxID=461836 RepID=A0A0L0DT25_THETB|nr:hypothetical protein AMSG_12353 [Thecamonas trahens ATCC 50062]KNC54578.1 hypothetical protein AMSG_12353 [Thecamonas trahens ATCC 50062]|eukprot:XP_013753596.1 hypothetical protein AMSG_12353 [Thecamonas trahens ATCC 50062]
MAVVSVWEVPPKVSAARLMGNNNTGNICIWPSEEVFAHLLLTRHAGLLARNSFRAIELGAGMTGLAGVVVAAAAASDTAAVVVTDGNPTSVDLLAANLAANHGVSWDAAVDYSADVALCGGRFDLVFAADCLFFEAAHLGLIHDTNGESEEPTGPRHHFEVAPGQYQLEPVPLFADKSGIRKPHISTNPASAWAYLVVAAVASAVYCNSLWGELFFDDEYAIHRNADVVSPDPVPWSHYWRHDYWGMPMDDPRSHKSFRPLVVLTFRANFLISGTAEFGFHLGNVLFHALGSALVLPIAGTILDGYSHASLFAALLFATHPVHAEAVAGVVGRAEVMCFVFYAAAFLAGVRAARRYHTSLRWSMAVCAFAAAATLCKETGITVFGVLFFYEMLYVMNWLELPVQAKDEAAAAAAARNPARVGKINAVVAAATRFKLVSWQPDRFWPVFVRQVSYALFGLVFMWWRLSLNQGVLPTWPEKDNQAAVSDELLPKLLNFPYIYAYNTWLLIFPLHLCADYSFESIPMIESFADVRVALTWALAAVVLGGCLYACGLNVLRMSTSTRVHLPVLAAAAFAAVPFLPSTNLFFLIGFLVAERVLYIPSLGWCLLLGYLLKLALERSTGRSRQLVLGLALLLLVAYSGRTLARNADWASEEALWRSAEAVVPSNGKVNFNLGNVHFARGEYAQAVAYFNVSLIASPDDPSTLINIATCYAKMNAFDTAIEYYEAASKLATNLGQFFNWGAILEHRGQYEEAIKVFHMASEFSPHGGRLALYQDDPKMKALAAMHEGTLLCRVGRGRDGLDRFYYAVRVDPNLAEAWMRIGLEHSVNGELDKAVPALERSLALDPSLHYSADELAKIRTGERSAADTPRELPLSAQIAAAQDHVAARPNDPAAHLALASLYHATGEYRLALASTNHALDHAPESIDALAFATQLHLEAGETRAALDAANRAAALPGATPRLHMLHGLALVDSGDTLAGVAALERAVGGDSSLAEAHLVLGRVALASGDAHRAAGRLRKAYAARVRAAGGDKSAAAALPVLYELAEALLAAGKRTAARKALSRLVAADPDFAGAQVLLDSLQ